MLVEQAEKKQAQLVRLDKKLAMSKQAAATVSGIESMAKKTIGGNVQLSPADWETVSTLAKEGVQSRGIIKRLQEKVSALAREIEITDLKTQLTQYGKGQSISDTMQYYKAKQRAPRRLAMMIADILRKPPERQEPDKTATNEKKHEQSL